MTWFIVEYENLTEKHNNKFVVFSETEEDAKWEIYETDECGWDGYVYLFCLGVYEGRTDDLKESCYYHWADLEKDNYVARPRGF